jgi:hypothetical protein
MKKVKTRKTVDVPDDAGISEAGAAAVVGLTETVRQVWAKDMLPEVRHMADALNGESADGPAPDAAPDAPQEITPDMFKRLDANADLARKAEEIGRAMAAKQFDVARVIGQMQTLKAFSDFSTAGLLRLFKEIKDRKVYRGVSVPQPDGTVRAINTFEEFCELMGTSRSKVDEDLQNAAVFGEAFLESANKAGLGYRQLRQLRALPEDEREKLKAATDDPEELRIQVEEIAAEMKAVKKQLGDATKTLKIRDDMIGKQHKELVTVRTELEKLRGLDVDEQAALDTERQSGALKAVIEDCGILIGAGAKFFATLNAALELDGLNCHVREELEATANMVGSRLADMFASQLDWQIDFSRLVYPDWYAKHMQESASSPETPANHEPVE